MRIDKIGFGYVKNLGGHENCKLYIEAALEPWEDPSQSLDLLRTKVAEELDLPDGWRDLRCKYNQEVAALRNAENALKDTQEKLKKAQEKWVEYQNFLTAHGVDPKTLTLDSPYLSRAIITAHKLDASTLDLLPPLNDIAEDCDDDYVDPYYGDEYDRLHDPIESDDPENSYF